MRRLKPDTRPDWRDPEMPVLWAVGIVNGVKKYVYRSPKVRQEYSQQAMDNPFSGRHWKNDPTYDLKKQRKKL